LKENHRAIALWREPSGGVPQFRFVAFELFLAKEWPEQPQPGAKLFCPHPEPVDTLIMVARLPRLEKSKFRRARRKAVFHALVVAYFPSRGEWLN